MAKAKAKGQPVAGCQIVVVKVDGRRYVRRLVVEACPYCGRPHWHAAGRNTLDDPVDGHLGVKLAGCGGGSYELVEGGKG